MRTAARILLLGARLRGGDLGAGLVVRVRRRRGRGPGSPPAATAPRWRRPRGRSWAGRDSSSGPRRSARWASCSGAPAGSSAPPAGRSSPGRWSTGRRWPGAPRRSRPRPPGARRAETHEGGVPPGAPPHALRPLADQSCLPGLLFRAVCASVLQLPPRPFILLARGVAIPIAHLAAPHVIVAIATAVGVLLLRRLFLRGHANLPGERDHCRRRDRGAGRSFRYTAEPSEFRHRGKWQEQGDHG